MYVWICKPCMALSRGNQDSALVLRFRTLSFQSTGRNWRQHLRYKLYGWTCFFSQMWFETSRFGCKDSLNFKYPCLKSPKGRQMMQNCVWTIRLLRLVKTSKGVSKSLFNPKGKFVAFSSVVYVNCSIKGKHARRQWCYMKCLAFFCDVWGGVRGTVASSHRMIGVWEHFPVILFFSFSFLRWIKYVTPHRLSSLCL